MIEQYISIRFLGQNYLDHGKLSQKYAFVPNDLLKIKCHLYLANKRV